jgi:hypothetical protein
MYARRKLFFEHFNGVRKSLANIIEAFNNMDASVDSRLITQAKRFQEFAIGTEEISVREKL